MSTIDRLFSDFVDAWNRGDDPRVEDCARARAARRARRPAARCCADWLAIAPTPALSPPAARAVAADPILRAAVAATGRDAGAWPELLPRLRERAGLSVRAVAERITGVFGLRGQEERAAARLEQMERGELDASRVSRRLLDALGTVLGVPGDELAEAGTLRFLPAAAPARPVPRRRASRCAPWPRISRRSRRPRPRAGAAADGRARPALPRRT